MTRWHYFVQTFGWVSGTVEHTSLRDALAYVRRMDAEGRRHGPIRMQPVSIRWQIAQICGGL